MAWESLLVEGGVLRTLAPRHAARAPGVCGAPRRRSASPLWALLYAFWSRWSRRASIVSDHGVEGTAREAYGVTPLDRNVVMSYSQNIRTRLTAGGYAPTSAHTAACLPSYDHGYSPAIWTPKVAGGRGWTG